MRSLVLSLLLPWSFLRADGFSDLKTALAHLAAQQPIKARVEIQLSNRDDNGDNGKPKVDAGAATVEVESGPDGLRIFWSREQVQAAAQEQAAKDPKAPSPVRRGMGALSATRLQDYLNGAPNLLRQLEGAELTGEKAVTWEGQPARLLSFKLNPPMSERDRKRIKEMDTSAEIWIDRDGFPLAAKSHADFKGRALLVISFESSSKEEFRFTHVGDRLVVTRHVRENSGSGGGESGGQKTVATLTVEE